MASLYRPKPRLFETFSQADRSLDRSEGGLGLGLSMVKGLVELHGGSVEAKSAGPGGGAEFTVWLPKEDELPALLPSHSPARPRVPAKGVRVLLVEDNRDVVLDQVVQEAADATLPLKLIEQQANHALHLLVGVQSERAGRQLDVAGGRMIEHLAASGTRVDRVVQQPHDVAQGRHLPPDRVVAWAAPNFGRDAQGKLWYRSQVPVRIECPDGEPIATLSAANSPHTITASYSGTSAVSPSSGSTILTVNPATLTVTADNKMKV